MGGYTGHNVFRGFSEDDIKGGLNSIRNCKSDAFLSQTVGEKTFYNCGKTPCICPYKINEDDPLIGILEGPILNFQVIYLGYDYGKGSFAFAHIPSRISGWLNKIKDIDTNISNKMLEDFSLLKDGLGIVFKKGKGLRWLVGGEYLS